MWLSVGIEHINLEFNAEPGLGSERQRIGCICVRVSAESAVPPGHLFSRAVVFDARNLSVIVDFGERRFFGYAVGCRMAGIGSFHGLWHGCCNSASVAALQCC